VQAGVNDCEPFILVWGLKYSLPYSRKGVDWGQYAKTGERNIFGEAYHPSRLERAYRAVTHPVTQAAVIAGAGALGIGIGSQIDPNKEITKGEKRFLLNTVDKALSGQPFEELKADTKLVEDVEEVKKLEVEDFSEQVVLEKFGNNYKEPKRMERKELLKELKASKSQTKQANKAKQTEKALKAMLKTKYRPGLPGMKPRAKVRGSKMVAAPAASSAIMRPRNGYSKRSDVEGGEILYSTITTAGEAANSVLEEDYVTPRIVAGSRMAVVSSLWEMFRLEFFELVYYPAVSSATTGQLCLYIDPDAQDTFTAGPTLTQRATNSRLKVIFSVWGTEPVTLAYSQHKQLSTLYTEPYTEADPHWNSCGKWALIALSAMPSATIGTLAIRFRVRFFEPTMEAPVSSNVSFWSCAGVTTSKFFGTTQTEYSNDLDLTIDDSTMTFERTGEYYMGVYSYAATTLTVSDTTIFNFDSNGTVHTQYCASVSANNVAWCTFAVTEAPCVLTPQNWASITAFTAQYVIVAKANSALPKGYRNGITNHKVQAQNPKVAELEAKINDMFLAMKQHSQVVDEPRREVPTESSISVLLAEKTIELERAAREIEELKSKKKLDKCWFCGDPNPDHIGRNCPQRDTQKVDPKVDPVQEQCRFCQKVVPDLMLHFQSCDPFIRSLKPREQK